jgi:hypothetical protein
MNLLRNHPRILLVLLIMSVQLITGCKPMLYPVARMFGVPAESELAVYRVTFQRLKGALPQDHLVVHTPCVFRHDGGKWDKELTPCMAEALTAQGFHAVPFEGADPKIGGDPPGANQLRFTWRRAREYAKWTAENRPAGAWHLYTDLVVDGGGTIDGMEFFIVDGQGNLALVRLLNSHHPSFQGIQRGSLASGCSVLARTLQITLTFPPERLFPPYGIG